MRWQSDRCRVHLPVKQPQQHIRSPQESMPQYLHSQVSSCWKVKGTSVSRTNRIVCVKQCYTRARKMTHTTLIAFPWISRTKLGTATESSCLSG